MDNRPIGVFDSGLGGLTAVRQIMSEMPGEDIIYFGDTARVPYGSKSRDTILKYTMEDIDFLLKHNIKLIIAACGTASSVALPRLGGKYPVGLLGVLDGACSEAVNATKNGRIGVIGTAGTVKSGKFEELIHKINADVSVFSQACPMFVHLVENGYAESEAARLIANDYLEPLKKENVDTLILGCTHYPLLERVISDIMGDGVTLISSGAMAAKRAKQYLTENGICSEKKTGGKSEFYVSDSVENFTALGEIFLGCRLNTKVHKTEAFSE